MKAHKQIGERGIAIYATVVILVMVIPMLGLSIDATLLYILKTRLQGAVDGAALAAARALARGSDDNTQKLAAADAAATYVKLNYPSSYFFSADVVVDRTLGNDVIIDTSVANQRTITVKAHVTEPTLFARWLNFASTNINASASTVRRDVNIVLVLDRSGSMTASGSCGPMKQAAINFIGNFSPGRDNVGLISFASSVLVQMPITNVFKAPDHTGLGIDPAVAINGIECQGSTSSAAALWNAYDQLLSLNQPAALNFVVFFTDGEPTGVAMNMPITGASPCNDPMIPTVLATDPTPSGLPAMYAGKYIPGLYAVVTSGAFFIGNAKNTASPNADGTPPLSTTSGGANDQIVAPFSTNCAYAAGWTNSGPNGTNWKLTSDFRGLPTADIYGNLTTGYQGTTASAPYLSIAAPSNGIAMATNAADSAASRIRAGTFDPAQGRGYRGIIINAIGLGNAAVPLPNDGIFLSRLTNASTSPLQPNADPMGIFKYAQQSSDIASAFGEIASEILRLAK